MSDDTTTTLRDAVQRTIAERAANEDGFLQAAIIDPRGTIEPIIAGLVGDDGELDLTGVNINVHVETPESIHLVVAAPESEVAGFRYLKFGGDLNLQNFMLRPISFVGGTSQGASCSGCDSTCNTDSGSTNHCAGGSCSSAAVL